MSLALSIGSHRGKGSYLSPMSELDVLLTVVLSRDKYRATGVKPDNHLITIEKCINTVELFVPRLRYPRYVGYAIS